ncbi:RDD family protein [Dyella sp. BiH032]|uniref:RDD family protein n=1 Tax=Dyella sp. BiH032 TaxID=3075430 RepID=UPI002892DBA7|nr:RDD family protein [Dyella sp. BiH032]WNL46130.1 RDD family protein [Dyella sp. BiH032]
MEVWIGRDGERHGPYTEADVREWLRTGRLSPGDLGWYQGMSDWQPLSSLFPEQPPTLDRAYSPPKAPLQTAPDRQRSLEDYAGFWKRVAAYIIDSIVLWIPNLLISRMMGAGAAEQALMQNAQGSDPHAALAAYAAFYNAMLPAILVQLVLTWLYFAFCESSSWQATLGKLALGIRVVDMEGNRISFLRATGRHFAKLLSGLILMIGYVMVAFTQRKQGLHDIIASTLVLNGRASELGAVKPEASEGQDKGSFNA